MVEYGVIDLGGDGSIRERGEAGGESSQGQLFDGPYGTRGSRSKEGHPVSRRGCFDGLEVALLGEIGSCTIGGEVRGAGLSCGGVKLFSEEGEQRRPPGLGAVGGALGGGLAVERNLSMFYRS